MPGKSGWFELDSRPIGVFASLRTNFSVKAQDADTKLSSLLAQISAHTSYSLSGAFIIKDYSESLRTVRCPTLSLTFLAICSAAICAEPCAPAMPEKA